MKRNEPTATELDVLRSEIGEYMSEKRLRHTLEVEREAVFIAEKIMPEREGSLRAAALLHDVAKELTSEKQLNYIRGFDIINCDSDKYPETVLHALAAPAVITERFPQYADEDILFAVRYHTTGRAEMTVFEAIIFLADYIEPTRKHESCRICREYFHSRIGACVNKDEAIALLTEAVEMSLSDTIAHVISSGKALDPYTTLAAEYIKSGGQLRR